MSNKELTIHSRSPFIDLFKVVRVGDIIKTFDDLWKSWNYDIQDYVSLQSKTEFPKVNVAETDDAYEVEVALAGFEKEDISMELKDNYLYIVANKNEKSSSEDTDKKYLMQEISSKSFRRVLSFKEKIVEHDIECSFKDGTIKCTLKKEEVKVKNDAVKILIN